MDLSIDNKPVIQGRLQLPAKGPWWGEFTLDALEGFDVGQRVTVRSSGGLELAATVQRTELVDEVPHVRLVGGRGGLNRSIAAQWHTGPGLSARTVLASWAEASGEQLSSTIAASVLNASIDRWVRSKGRSIDALDALTEALGVTWRVLPDGTVWLGSDTDTALDRFTYDVVARRVATGSVELAVDAPVPQLMPGRTFEGRKIGTVEYLLTPQKCRAVIALIASTEQDTLQELVTAMVRRALWRERYRGMFRAEVVAVQSDWSVDLRPANPEWPELTAVPVRSGSSGVKSKLSPGAKVAFEFEDADPMRPVVTMWEVGSQQPEEIAIDTKPGSGDVVLQSGTLEVARRTDPAGPSSAMTTWMTEVSTRVSALTAGMGPVLNPAPLPTLNPPVGAIATITSGAPKVKA
jgi:hypothetical protein